MSFYLKDNPSDPVLIDLYWDEDLLYTVAKKLFLKELTPLSFLSSLQEFVQAFSLLEIKLAKRVVVNLLARKGYLSQELEKKLSVKGFSRAAIEKAIAFGKNGGYIDDEQELGRLIRSEVRKGRGPQAVLFKLKHKRVPEEQLARVKQEMRRTEKQALQEWLKKKGMESCPEDYKQRQKLYGQLMRRGFSSEAISSVLKDEWN